MANKRTNKDFFNEVKAIAIEREDAELQAWAEKQIKGLEDKAANRKPTKTQKENEGVKDAIVEALAEIGKPATVTEILATDKFEATVTNQKVTALLRQMIADNVVVKTADKKKSFFALKAE